MILENVRCDWVFIWEANKKGKFGVCAMLPKDSKVYKQVEKRVAEARAEGIAKNKFTEKDVERNTFMKGLRDGDDPGEGRGDHYKGHGFMNGNNPNQPGIVGSNGQKLMDASVGYSGCYFNLDVSIYPYAHPEGGKGVAMALNNIMFVKEGDRLDGRQSAETAFADFATDDSDGDLQ